MDEEPKTLKSVLAQAEQKRKTLEGVYDTTSDSYRDTLSAAIAGYQEALELISRLSVFSPNESVEDISTSDLPYLLVNYRLAELVQKTPSTSPQARKQTISCARDALGRYIHLLDSYSLLTPQQDRLLQIYTEDPASFSTVSTSDPTARRNAKIENFRAEKELRQRLEFLQRRPGYGADGDGGDEEAVRAVHLANLGFCTHQAFQALEGINREMEVLALAPAAPPDPQGLPSSDADADARQRRRPGDGYSERLDGPVAGLGRGGPLLTKEGKPLQPFTLLNTRQELRKGVFRPSHNLPTMTIDEYLEEERRRGGIIEGGGEASLRTAEPDEDDMEKADAETMKARAWDEFKEANPRGAGNTLNRG